MPILLGFDTGGTFTDAVLFDETKREIVAAAKALTTRHDLSVGIGEAMAKVLTDNPVAPDDIGLVSLSTTLATNALVEGQGGQVALILIGFEDGVMQRAGLSEAIGDDPVISVAGGHDAHGGAKTPLDVSALETALEALTAGVTGVAIAAQFAVRNPAHEIAARDLVRSRLNLPVTCSHELSSRLNGPRRALTSVLNARLIGLIEHLIAAAERLMAERGISAPLMIVRGDGALIAAPVAREHPIETILSGPAASLVGAAFLTDCPNALVSDIGGTTTDVAVLRNGIPERDADGATVGGWRTMVEAVAMRTFGLGGDSEVRLAQDGLTPKLLLGPRRAIPLSLLATTHGELVHTTLDRQLRQDRVSEREGIIARAVRPDVDVSDALPKGPAGLYERLRAAPQPIDKLLRQRLEGSYLDRLVAGGHVQLARVTPSDAAHVLGLHSAWDLEAARKALDLFAKRNDNRGRHIAESGVALARTILDRLQRRSAEVLLDVALAEDDIEGANLSRSALGAAWLDGKSGLVAPSAPLTVPVIGLGASAATYYPGIAERLGTTAIVPERAGVANAVGAVVGRVSVSVTFEMSSPVEGQFRLHGVADGAAAREALATQYTDLDEARAAALAAVEAEARAKATAAGAADVDVQVRSDERITNIEGREMFVSSTIVATASGRPHIGRRA